MKKNLLRIVCILMALFMLPVHAFAAEAPAQEEALTGAAAINYVQKNADFVGSEYRTITTSQNNRLEFRVDTYTKTTATDVTTAAMARSGGSATEYETTTYEVWNTRAGGSASNSGSDEHGYAVLSVTLYNTEFDNVDGFLFSRMTRIAGTCTIVTSGAELRSHSYKLYEVGFNVDYNRVNRVNTYSAPTGSYSWSSNINSGHFPGICIQTVTCKQYAEYTFVIASTENNDTWDGNFKISIYDRE